MITVTETMIDKISNLTAEQFDIMNALLDEFTSKNCLKKSFSRHIGIAEEIEFPADFDDIDYCTKELFDLR